jgi:hypothetical protein
MTTLSTWRAVAAVALTTVAAAFAQEPMQSPQTQPAERVPPVDEEEDATIDLNAPPEPATQPADRSPTEATAEDILREFQKERPRAVPLLPTPPEDESITRIESPVDGDMPAVHLPDGYFLVDRVGRLTQIGDWWLITFVSDNNPLESPDPPMRLLPNRMLERMVRESQGAARSVEFVVSGEVTEFMGENYLLLRKLMRRRDLGNLSN